MKRLAWAAICATTLVASLGQPVATAGAPSPLHTAAVSADPACPNCPAPEPCTGCWQPPLQARWQYQLQARPGVADASGGIDVDICETPAAGGACVSPEV